MDRSMEIMHTQSGEVAASTPLQALAQGSMFWRPGYIASSSWLHHLPWLFWLTEALRPERCVTLGAGQGSPHLAFCQGISRLGMTSECLLVQEASSDIAEDVHGWGERLYGTISAWLPINLRKGARQVENGSVDVLALDVREADNEDLDDLVDRWLPKLSSRGVVLFPSINKKGDPLGIHQLFQEMAQYYPALSFTHGDGLGVLAVGAEINPMIQTLLDRLETPESAALVRDVFARLGRGCADQAVIIDQKSQLKGYQQQLAEVENVREELDEARINQRISEQRFQDSLTQLESLKLERQQLSTDSNGWVSQLTEVSQRLHEAQAALQIRDTEVERLQRELERKDQELETHLHELAEYSDSAEQRIESHNELSQEVEETSSMLLEELESSRQRWEGEKQLFEASAEESLNRISQLENEVTRLNTVIDGKDQLFAEFRELGAERNKDHESKRSELSALNQSLDQYRTKLDELNSQHALKQRERDELVKQNDALQHKLTLAEQQTEELDAATKEQEVLRQQLEAVNNEKVALTNLLDVSKQQAKSRQDELKQTNKSLEQQLASLNKEYKARQQASRRELVELQKELAERDKLIASQFEELSAIAEQTETKEATPDAEEPSPRHETDHSHQHARAAHAEGAPSTDSKASPTAQAPQKSFFGSMRSQGLDRRKQRKLERQAKDQAYKELSHSQWFDAEWYLEQYPDVAQDEQYSKYPAMHYLKFGGFEGRDPSQHFDSEGYLDVYPDVAESGINPLLHFIRKGQQEDRSPRPR